MCGGGGGGCGGGSLMLLAGRIWTIVLVCLAIMSGDCV